MSDTYQVHELKPVKGGETLIVCWGDKLTFSEVQNLKAENRYINFSVKRNI